MEAAVRVPRSAAPDADDLSPVSTLLRMLRHMHPHAHAHGERVAAVAAGIGRALGLGPAEVETLRHAGTLHDVGKLCVPVSTLGKKGPLSRDERTAVRCHPAEGERLLRPFVTHGDVLAAVRWHHERWDGGGYPDGLRASAAPLVARVVAVADAYCAMTEERPYRPPLAPSTTAAEIARCAGTQFDRGCASALVTALRDGAELPGP